MRQSLWDARIRLVHQRSLLIDVRELLVEALLNTFLVRKAEVSPLGMRSFGYTVSDCTLCQFIESKQSFY